MTTLPALPSDLPPITKAKLPATYEGAKTALAACTRIDECQDWADKAEALASYARQAQDDALRKLADRIQARAVRRCGEILTQIRAATNRHDVSSGEAARPAGRKQAARDAGLSEHRRKTAIRVSRIPDAEFEEAVEAEEPTTVTALAHCGTQKLGKKEAELRALRERAAVIMESPPRGGGYLDDYLAARALVDLLQTIDRRSQDIDPEAARRGLEAAEVADALSCLAKAERWIAAAKAALGADS